MSKVSSESISDFLSLSKLLGEFGQIKRATLLPNGEFESDSHHSFALALIAYELARQYAPELDQHKILLYGLVHDLTEIITGDMVTLTASEEELLQKASVDTKALAHAEELFRPFPHIFSALAAYEKKTDDESLFVYWIDKTITIPTHFYDNGANLKKLGINSQDDIRQWHDRTLKKLYRQSKTPHASAVEIFERAYQKMHDELLPDNHKNKSIV